MKTRWYENEHPSQIRRLKKSNKVGNRHFSEPLPSSLVLLLLLKNQATSPANSLRLCNLRRLTSAFVVLVKFTDFEWLKRLCSKQLCGSIVKALWTVLDRSSGPKSDFSTNKTMLRINKLCKICNFMQKNRRLNTIILSLHNWE